MSQLRITFLSFSEVFNFFPSLRFVRHPSCRDVAFRVHLAFAYSRSQSPFHCDKCAIRPTRTEELAGNREESQGPEASNHLNPKRPAYVRLPGLAVA